MLDWSLFLECDCIRNVVLPLIVCYFAIRFCWFLWTQVKTFVIYAGKPAFDFVGAADGGFGKSYFGPFSILEVSPKLLAYTKISKLRLIWDHWDFPFFKNQIKRSLNSSVFIRKRIDFCAFRINSNHNTTVPETLFFQFLKCALFELQNGGDLRSELEIIEISSLNAPSNAPKVYRHISPQSHCCGFF